MTILSYFLGPVVDTDWLNTTTFASCSTDKRICICRVGSEEPVEILNGHSVSVIHRKLPNEWFITFAALCRTFLKLLSDVSISELIPFLSNRLR